MRLVQNSLHHDAAATLRERIFTGDPAPGIFRDEAALCADLAISQTPLHED